MTDLETNGHPTIGASVATANAPTGKIAFLDFGSNDFKILIYDFCTTPPTLIHKDEIPVKLAEGTHKNNRALSLDAVHRACHAASVFRDEIESRDITEVYAVGTAALRYANDANALNAIQNHLGHAVNIISGTKEAVLTAYAIHHGIPNAEGIFVAVGGASLETGLIRMNTDRVESPSELPIGSITLHEHFKKGEDIDSLIHREFRKAAAVCAHEDRVLYISSGLFRTIGRLAFIETHNIDITSRFPGGLTINTDMLLEELKRIKTYGPDELKEIFAKKEADLKHNKISPHDFNRWSKKWDKRIARREETIAIGARLLEIILQETKPSTTVFCEHGIREGMAYALLHKLHIDDLKSARLVEALPSSPEYSMPAPHASAQVPDDRRGHAANRVVPAL